MATTSTLHIHEIKKLAQEILKEVKEGRIKNKKDLFKYKKFFASKYKLSRLPSNAEILNFIEEKKVRKILMRKPVRTISGIAIIAVMTSPHPCPHGKCIPCPGGPPFSPQSYTGEEPAALRARRNKFDPYMQTADRLKQLKAIGHPTDKIELIIMGGTFPARDYIYQEWFVKRCYDAMNGREASSLEEAKKLNEKARHRCIGLTVETRPDWCYASHVEFMLYLGATRVEIGAQIVDDRVLHEMKRGHTVFDIIEATRIAKDVGLKICYHIMPGLMGSSYENDLECFKKIFRDSRFMPDMLKIYPTLVVKSSMLYEKWKNGEYEALKEEDAIELIAEMKKYVPPWVRIQRIERDIPSNLIEEGIRKSNLRQLIKKRMEEKGYKCRCIRCREIGHLYYKEGKIAKNLDIIKREYIASNGKEIFISIEDKENDIIAGYCRLRIPYKPYKEELKKCAIVRELKVHGPMVEIGKREEEKWQHKGFGKTLMEEAEKLSLKYGKEKILVLSGIGVKEYYRKLGYNNYGVYMMKKIE